MKHALTALALLAATPGLATAEMDGTLGVSSTGSLKLSLDVQEQKRIQITRFQDVEQTIERGIPQGKAPDFKQVYYFARQGDSNPLCVRMDGGGDFTLDWIITPLTDGARIEPVTVDIYRGTDGQYILQAADIMSTVEGRMPNLQAAAFGTGCSYNNRNGTYGVHFDLGGTNRTYDTIGTYEATITLTVSPQ